MRPVKIEHCMSTREATLFLDNKQKAVILISLHIQKSGQDIVLTWGFSRQIYSLEHENVKFTTFKRKVVECRQGCPTLHILHSGAFQFTAKGCTFYLAVKELGSARD